MVEKRFFDENSRLVYGRLTLTGVTYLEQGAKQKRRKVQALCECGKLRFYDLDLIKRGQTKSCGCLRDDVAREKSTKHGLSEHPLYKVWLRLREKCNNLESAASKNYGQKGVCLCEEWDRSYMAFFNWAIEAGWEPGLQIDKDKLYIEKYGGKRGLLYSPEFCCFLTQKENKQLTSRSHFLEFNGERKTISEWAKTLGINRCVISNRLREFNGDVEKTLSTPVLKRKHITTVITIAR